MKTVTEQLPAQLRAGLPCPYSKDLLYIDRVTDPEVQFIRCGHKCSWALVSSPQHSSAGSAKLERSVRKRLLAADLRPSETSFTRNPKPKTGETVKGGPSVFTSLSYIPRVSHVVPFFG